MSTPGAFRPDGSFDQQATERGPADAYARELIELRRNSDVSPREIAQRVETSPFPDLLSPVEHAKWMTMEALEDWQLAPSTGSFGDAVKREGRGALGRRWEGGRWV